MFRPAPIGALALALALTAQPAQADVSKNPQSAPKGAYELVERHSTVHFCIEHLGISQYCGWCPKLSGTLRFNGAQPASSSVEVSIDLTKAQTRSAELDGRLRDDFFEVSKFATATFKSTSAKVTGANQGEVTGDLTLHGVTKPVTLKTQFNGGEPNPLGQGHLVGFSAQTTIKLVDFGLANVAWKVFVGDEATLRIEAEFNHE